MARTKSKTSDEDIVNPAKVLLDNGLIDATAKGKPDKAATRYAELSRALASLVVSKKLT